jgi:hypothetical protein
MPYIITTKQVDGAAYDTVVAVSRRAVATLDEARTWVHRESVPDGLPREMEQECWSYLDSNIARIGDQGGTVGPLPDGTVIEVERVSGYALAQRVAPLGLNPRDSDAAKLVQILDVYNAAQH